MTKVNDKKHYYFIDLFCGAGGVTSGVHGAKYKGKRVGTVIACVNHDLNAILSHEANHPKTVHYTEDIRTLDISGILKQVRAIRARNKRAVICLWASLECTNFSKAKGGMPRDADSRTLAEHLFRYVDVLTPDMIWIENVEEFMSWGPLCENGKPISKRAGSDYIKWCNAIQERGYKFDWRLLNAANYGAYTSRKRYFAQFVKHDYAIGWPEITHNKHGKTDVFGTVHKWKAVKDVLELQDTGESIFVPGRIRSDKTFERIYHGLIKFVAGGKDAHQAFLMKYNSTASNGNTEHSTVSIDSPAPVIDTQNRLRLVEASFLTKYQNGKITSKQNRNYDVNEPIHTVDTQNRFYLINIENSGFLMKYFSGKPEHKNISLDGPCGTIRTSDGTAFVSVHYGNGFNTSLDTPASTLTTKDRFSLISTQFIYRQYSSGQQNQSVEMPSGAVATIPKLNLVSVAPFIASSNFDGHSTSIDTAAPTQTAGRHHHYLINPQWFNTGATSIDDPCFTLIARQDKTPAYLCSAEGGSLLGIEVLETDMPHALLIKEFMLMYGICDVKMRMLHISELKQIQGFGSSYTLIGSKTKQKWMLGNAVEVNQARVLIESSYEANAGTGVCDLSFNNFNTL